VIPANLGQRLSLRFHTPTLRARRGFVAKQCRWINDFRQAPTADQLSFCTA